MLTATFVDSYMLPKLKLCKCAGAGAGHQCHLHKRGFQADKFALGLAPASPLAAALKALGKKNRSATNLEWWVNG